MFFTAMCTYVKHITELHEIKVITTNLGKKGTIKSTCKTEITSLCTFPIPWNNAVNFMDKLTFFQSKD
jgi:hypothetical protein